MQNLLVHVKKSISMNREIYNFRKFYDERIEEEREKAIKKLDEMQRIISAAAEPFLNGGTVPLYAVPQMVYPRQFGRNSYNANYFYDSLHRASIDYKRERAIMSIRAKYEGNRAERRSKHKDNNTTINERPKTLQDIIKQKQNRVRYSFNSTNISDKFSNNKYDKGINNRW